MAGSNKRWHDPNDLKKKIRTQIEYYFSNENLHKDVYFRNQMDDQGWVSLEVIAQFNRVKSLLLYTNDPSVLYDALLTSKSLEVPAPRILSSSNAALFLFLPLGSQYCMPE